MLDTSIEQVAEDAIVERARRGSAGAFASLVARYGDRVYRLAFRMSGNASDAEEITQETFLQVHRGLPSFHGGSRIGTWIYRIAMNEAITHRRAAARRPLEFVDVASPGFAEVGADTSGHRADELMEDKDLAARVRAALAQLEEPLRAALVLRDLEELTTEEAASVLRVSPDAVRQRAHRARLKLREILAATSTEAAERR